jgi:hypothetical protein
MSNIVKEDYVTKTNTCIRILRCICSSSTYFVKQWVAVKRQGLLSTRSQFTGFSSVIVFELCML